MKTIITSALALSMTALLLTTAHADPSAAKKPVPFRGDVEGTETHELEFPCAGPPFLCAPSGFQVEGNNGTGNATHLGRFTASWTADVEIVNEDLDAVGVGTRTFVAANGDMLFTTFSAIGTGFPLISITEVNTIVGGTGRFDGATGEFELERFVQINFTGPDNLTFGSFDGTILFAD